MVVDGICKRFHIRQKETNWFDREMHKRLEKLFRFFEIRRDLKPMDGTRPWMRD
jgi:hypothetical protein